MSKFSSFAEYPPRSLAGAGVFPGVARAMATRRRVMVEGTDLFGARQRAAVPVSGIGPLLVLKLNAFAGRKQAKDAYDVLLAVSRFAEGPDAAIAAFQEEASAGNRGYARAVETLRCHFLATGQSRGDSVGSVVLARSACANPSSFARYGSRTGPRLAHSSACASICFAITSIPTEPKNGS